MFQHDRDHFTRMIASLFPVLNMLTSGSLGPLLSPPKHDTETTPSNTASIIRFGSVAYLGLDSLTDSMVGSAIGSILLSDLAAVAGDRYNYGIGTRPVTIFIDEAAEVINDRFIQLLNKGRGAGIKMVVATQTFADFAARTGSVAKARQVLANINNVIALRVLDAETQKYFTDGLPMTKVKGLIRDQSTSAGSSDPLVYSASAGERMVEQETELFPPALLGNLPNLEFVAKLSGGRVWKGRVPILGEPGRGAAA
jgi:conjugal transfer pilus assembly protein TraD